MQYSITASIVAYNNNRQVLLEAITSFLNTTLPVQLYLVDNSPTDVLRLLCVDERLVYIFNNKNIGFGAGHNIALREALNKAPYHLVLNPDVYFEPGNLEKIYEFMNQHTDVGLLMPKILYPDGELQYLCKLLPTPLQFFERRFMKWNKKRLERQNELFELRFTGYDKLMDVPYLSGCFMFLRTSALMEVGLFDERIFMYSEDMDLSRRMHQKFRTVYYPEAKVYHHFAKGSHRSLKLLWYALHGNIVYFTKWGWLSDPERNQVNQNILSKLTSCTNSHP